VLSIADIFKNHNEEIYRYFFIRTSSKETAEDLASEVFIKFIKTIDSYDSTKSSVRTWLYLIAKGILINYFKKESSHKNLGAEIIEDLVSDEDLDQKANISLILVAINGMAEADRELLILRYVNGLKVKEIAEVLNLNYINAKVKIHRSLLKLKNLLND